MTSVQSYPTSEPKAFGLSVMDDIGLHQAMKWLDDQDEYAEDPLANISDIPSTILAQELDAGGPRSRES